MQTHLIGSLLLVASLVVGAPLALKGSRSWGSFLVALVVIGLAVACIVKMLVTHQPLY